MSSQLGRLLQLLGRDQTEVVSVLSQVAGQSGILNVHWTTVGEADSLVDNLAGVNVWYGVQPISRPDTGRGRATDITGFVALYCDIDWVRPGKPDGITREQSMEFIDKLSDILGQKPVAMVASGNGVQPYWRVERCDPSLGRVLLQWWRGIVLEVASEMKVCIDSQVYDLPRILRAPGPPNLKDPENPQRTGLIEGQGHTLTVDHLLEVMAARPSAEPTNASTYDRRGGDLSPRDSERFFTQAQAMRYINEHVMHAVRNTPEGSGFNAALNSAAFNLFAFVPEFLTEEQAIALLERAVVQQFPNGCNQQDWATIESGMSNCAWQAKRAPDDMATNPFWDHYESVENLPLAPMRGRPTEVHYGGGTVLDYDRDVTEVTINGRKFVTPTVRPKDAPTEGCYLPDEFWLSRDVLGRMRELAWATQTCPEAVLISILVRLAGSLMPNIKVHGGIGSPASMNLMGLLVGRPGAGKSIAWKVTGQNVTFVGAAKPIEFTPASGQGLIAAYGQWRKAKGGDPGGFERTSYVGLGMLDESDTISALREQKGSTLSSVLRSAAMGGPLGSQTMDTDRRTRLEAGSYAFALLACAQPLRMGWLLNADEMAGGLPQRFLWAPASPMFLPVDPSDAEEILLQMPFEATGKSNPFNENGCLEPRDEHVIMAPDRVMREIARRNRERQMFGGDPMEAHADLTRLKVAAYLAILDGRLEMTEDDYALAGQIIRMSNNVCSWTWGQLREASVDESYQRARARGKADATAAMTAEEARIEALASKVLAKINAAGDEGIAQGAISANLSKGGRENLEAALELLFEREMIVGLEVSNNNGFKLYKAGTVLPDDSA